MIGRSDRVLVHGYNIAIANGVTRVEPKAQREKLDAAVLSSDNRVYESGFKNATIAVDGLYDNNITNADGITDVIAAAFEAGDEKVVTVGYGVYAVGSDARMFDGCVMDWTLPITVNALTLTNANFQSNNGVRRGRWLMSSQLNAGTTNGTTPDNGAATSNGGFLQVHLENTDASDVDVKVQHSTNGTVWADLAGAAVNNLSAAHDAGTATVATGTTVNRYLRAVAVVTGGNTVLLSVAFARG